MHGHRQKHDHGTRIRARDRWQDHDDQEAMLEAFGHKQPDPPKRPLAEYVRPVSDDDDPSAS